MELKREHIEYILDEYQQRLLNFSDDSNINDDDFITSLKSRIESKKESVGSTEELEALFQEIGTAVKEKYGFEEMFISNDILKNMLDSLE